MRRLLQEARAQNPTAKEIGNVRSWQNGNMLRMRLGGAFNISCKEGCTSGQFHEPTLGQPAGRLLRIT